MAVHNNVPIKRRQRKNFRDRGTIATRSIRLGNAVKLFIIVARKNTRGEDPTLLPSLRSTNAILVRDEKQREEIFPAEESRLDIRGARRLEEPVETAS